MNVQKSQIRFLYEALKPYWPLICIEITLATSWAVLQCVDPYLAKMIIDRLNGASRSQAFAALSMPVIFFVITSIYRTLSYRINDYIWLYLGPGIKRQVVEKLMQRMIQHSHQLYQEQMIG